MKIGIDARPLISREPTGIGIYLVNILKYINEQKDDNEYFLYADKPIENEIVLGSNFHKRIIPAKISIFWITFTMQDILRKDGIEIFWGTYHHLPLRMKGVKYLLTVHDLAFLVNPSWTPFSRNIVWKYLVPLSVKNAEHVIAISEATKRDILKFCDISENKISVIYNGGPGFDYCSSLENEKEILEQLGLEKGKYILDIGTISPRKNMETLVRSFNLIAEGYPDMKLVLAGGKGRKCESVLRLVEKSPHRDRIFLAGYVQAKERNVILKNAAVFAFPSHYEGFGIPVLEAMRHEQIVVTADNSSLREVGGEAALYVKNENDENELYEVLKQALELSEAEKQQRKQQGVKRAEHFSWKDCAESVYKCLNSLEEA